VARARAWQQWPSAVSISGGSRCGDGEGALARLDGSVGVLNQTEILAQTGGDPSEPRLIPEGSGERLGLAKGVERSPEFAKRMERVP